MRYLIPYDLTISNSNIGEYENADGTTNTPWSRSETISGAGVVRQYNDRVYQSKASTKKLVIYIWNDADPQNNYNTTTLTDTTDDGSAVPIVSGETTVYVVSSEKYYISKFTGTISFIDEDHAQPQHFDEVTDFSLRHDYYIPTESTLKWKDLGASNRTASVAKAINKTSSKNATSFWQEFETKNVSSFVLYNVKAETIKIEIRRKSDDVEIVAETQSSIMLDFTSFREWFDSSLEDPKYNKKVIFTPDFYYLGEVIVKMTVNNVAELPEVGEILVGRFADGGVSKDGVPTPTETDSEIIKLDSGEIVLDGEGDPTRVWRTMQLDIFIDTPKYDLYSEVTAKIINRRILAIGENTDDPVFQSLVLYGAVTRATPTLTSNSTKSNIQIDVREFTEG